MRWIVVALAVALGVGVLFTLLDSDSLDSDDDLGENSSQSADLPAPSPVPKRRTQLFQGSRAPIETKKVSGVSEACKTYWNQLLSINLRDLNYPPKINSLPLAKGCEKTPRSLELTHSAILASCKGFTQAYETAKDEMEWRSKMLQCQADLFEYRAQITEFLTKDTPLAEISDPKVLLDKMMARLSSNPLMTPEVADRLLEVEPNFYPAAKAAALTRFIVAEGKANPNDPYWDEFDKSLGHLNSLNNEDDKAQVQELMLMSTIRRYNDPEQVRRKVSEIFGENTSDSKAVYALAWADNKSGDVSAAISKVKELYQNSESQNEKSRYEQTLSCLESSTNSQGCFSTQISLGAGELDPFGP